MTYMPHDYVFKYIIVGDSGVGKTNIMTGFVDRKFHHKHDMTIGVEFATKIIKCGDLTIKLQIWDTAGQESFKAVTRAYYRGTIGCLIAYDISDRKTFESITHWISEVKQYCDPNIVTVIVGNKNDINKRDVSYQEGAELAHQHNMLFFETSAKTGENVSDCFMTASRMICDKIKSGDVMILPNNKSIKLLNTSTKTDNPSYYKCFCS